MSLLTTLTSDCDTSAEQYRCPFTEGSSFTRHTYTSDANCAQTGDVCYAKIDRGATPRH